MRELCVECGRTMVDKALYDEAVEALRKVRNYIGADTRPGQSMVDQGSIRDIITPALAKVPK